MQKFIIQGHPVPWRRSGRSGNRYYDTQKNWKVSYGIMIASQHGNLPLYEKALHVDMTFYFETPKMGLEKRKLRENTPHSVRPDIDNCAKFILDCANNVLWRDDSVIASMVIKKLYSMEPRTEFIITEI